MTEQIKQKLKDVLIEHKNIAASEYNDEDAFVGIYFCDLVDIIDGIIHNIGWHPASEHPPVDKETGFSECVVGVMPGDTVGFPQYVRYQKNEFYDRWIYGYTGVPSAINIKWWCYLPKED